MSVCLFVMLLNVRVCAPDFAMKALEYRNGFDAVGLSLSTRVKFSQIIVKCSDSRKCRSPKTAKFGVFAAESDTINRSRRNLARITRGHNFKLFLSRSRVDVRKHFLSACRREIE